MIQPYADSSYHLLLPQLRMLAGNYEVGLVSGVGRKTSALKRERLTYFTLNIPRSITPSLVISTARLIAIMRRWKPDIVHTHSSIGGFIGRLAARLSGVPVVVHTVHGFPFTEDQAASKRWAYAIMERIAARWSDRLFHQSHEDVMKAKELRIGRPADHVWIGNGVDLARFGPQLEESGARLVFVGRVSKPKGVLDIPSVLLKLQGAGLQTTISIVGPDDGALTHLLAKADELGVRDSLDIRGPRDDIRAEFEGASLFVFPSRREGVPRSVIEAQVSGLPVVAYRIRGCREVVRHGVTGLLIEPFDVEAFCDAVVRLRSDRALRGQMRVNAIANRDEWSEDRVLDRLRLAYDRLNDHRA